MYTPDINIKIDLEKETETFIAFLRSKKFPQQREVIFRSYPDLKLILEGNDLDENEIVHSFVGNKYAEHDTIIKSVVLDSREKIEKYGKTILEQLSLLMDYTWPKEHKGYLVVPTILPFSPFKENTIFFSIIRKIKGSKNKDDVNHEILPLLAHEISHLMLGDISKQEEEKNIFGAYGWTTLHFLQEIFAPILMNQESLIKILGIENYLGNPYLRHLNIKGNMVSENIVIHFKKIYETMKFSEKRHFTEITKKIADELESISAVLGEKLKMWNENGHNIFSNELLLEEYQKPILLK